MYNNLIIKRMENTTQTEKLPYEELKKIADQWRNEAEQWRKRAYEEAGKISRITLLFECLKLQIGYIEFKETLFAKEAIEHMSNELLSILYPPPKEEAPIIPLVETEEVN